MKQSSCVAAFEPKWQEGLPWRRIIRKLKDATQPMIPTTSPAQQEGREESSGGQVWTKDNIDASQRTAAHQSFMVSKVKQMNATQAKLYQQRAGSFWEKFYRSNEDRFFLDRHYLHRDFAADFSPALKKETWLLELGCGTGASVLPLLSKLPMLHVCACDLSRTAIRLLNKSIEDGEHSARAAGFVADACCPSPPPRLRSVAQPDTPLPTVRAGAEPAAAPAAADPEDIPAWAQARVQSRGGFDSVLMLFMLSAMAPPPAPFHRRAFQLAAQSLRPGGTLLFRDYGELDAAELRFSPGHQLAEHLFVRRDGTQAYFFGEEELRGLAREAGLEVLECTLLRRRYVNRSEGATLRRVFAHARFRKPRAGGGTASAPAATRLHDRAMRRQVGAVSLPPGRHGGALAGADGGTGGRAASPWDALDARAKSDSRDPAGLSGAGERAPVSGTTSGGPGWLAAAQERAAEASAACETPPLERARGLLLDLAAAVSGRRVRSNPQSGSVT